MDLNEDRKIFLENFYKEHGDFRLHYITQKNRFDGWTADVLYSKATDEQKYQANLRRIKANELILDYENKDQVTLVKQILKDRNWGYELWDTGSRGYHFRLLFPELSKHERIIRNQIRKYLVIKFGSDKATANEETWLALEFAPHFKTGNMKTLVETVNGENVFDDTINRLINKISQDQETDIVELEIEYQDVLTNPYLQYALNNKIERGGRDLVLFKNLAILLKKGGIKGKQLQEIVEKIVANCPGKTVGEFIGWLKRVKKDPTLQYNKYELIKWSEENGHPVFEFRTEGFEKLLENTNYFEKFSLAFNREIVQQRVWGRMLAYSTLATALDERDRDLRIHLIMQSYSTTGKDEGVNFARKILDRLGYKTSTPSSITDKTLIGGINELNRQHNQKYELQENQTKEVKGKQYSWKDPIELGCLSNHHWVAFSEAESVFRPGEYNKQVQVILRQAMDEKREIEKGLGGYMIKLNTNTTIILTTYPMHDTIFRLLNNGLFQRCLFFNKELTQEDNQNMLNAIISSNFKGRPFDENVIGNMYTDSICSDIRKIVQWYHANKSGIIFEDNVEKYISNRIHSLTKDYFLLLGLSDSRITDALIRRGLKTIKKLSIVHAVAQFKIIVDISDVKAAFYLFKECLDSVRKLIIDQNKTSKFEFVLINILTEKERLSSGDLFDYMSNTVDSCKSTSTFTKYMNNCIGRIVLEEREGKAVYYRLKSN